MSLVRSEIVSHVRANLGARPSDTSLDTRILAWLNFAQRDLARVRVWRDLVFWDKDHVITKADERYAGAPGNLRTMYNALLMNDTLSRPMEYVPPETFDQRYPYPEGQGSGQPAVFTWRGPNFEFSPIPDDVYHVQVYGAFWPSDFTASEDRACQVNNVDHLLISGATAEGYDSFGEPERAAYWRRKYQMDLARAAKTDGPPRTYRPQYGSEAEQYHWKAVNRLTDMIA